MPGNDTGFSAVMIGWAVLGIHILWLLISGLIGLSVPEERAEGRQLLLACLLVAIIGHGLCFFNGLMSMGNVH